MKNPGKSSWCVSGALALLALAAPSAGAQAGAAPSATETLGVFMPGGRAGEQVTTRAADGEVTVRFRYRSNGRGPDYVERYRIAPDGTLASFDVTGTSTFGAKVDEHFSVRDGKARWKTLSEQGEAKPPAGAMYVPLNGSYATASETIAVLAARPDGRLPLLPGGALTQRKLDEIEVARGSERRQVQLLAQTGLGFSPHFLWATTGPKPRLFASVRGDQFIAIEDGWEGNWALLAKHQQAAEARLLRDLAAKLFRPMPGLTVITNARVFDSETATLGAPSDVYVLRGRITAVQPAGSPMRGVDRTIDAAGRVLLPGLFDMHGHVGRWEGGLNLASGVTTVRDMGNSKVEIAAMLDEIARGELLSPQLVTAGMIEGKSEHANRTDYIVGTLDEAKDAIDWYAGHGYPQLKVYNSFPKAILADTVAYAHLRGMRVSGHVPAFLRAQDVVDAGFDEIQHINQVMLNFLVTPTTDTRSLDRFILPAEKVAGLDFDSKPVQDFIALLARKQVVIDPTLSTFEFIRHRDGTPSDVYASVADHFPPDERRFRLAAEMAVPDEKAATYDKSFRKMVEFVGRLYRAGVPLVAGTDELAGFTLHRELEYYVDAGLTPAQVLQIATRNGARYSRTSADRGSITPGKLADLVLVDGDPTKHISDVRKVALVITQGRAVSPAAVFAALGVRPFGTREPALVDVRSSAATPAVAPAGVH